MLLLLVLVPLLEQQRCFVFCVVLVLVLAPMLELVLEHRRDL